MFPHSLNNYFLSVYYVPGTILDTEAAQVNKADKNLALIGLILYRRETDNFKK